MKLSALIAVLLVAACNAVFPASSHAQLTPWFWRQVTGCASWVTQGVDDEVYTVGCDGPGNASLWHYTGDGGSGAGAAPWSWEQLPLSAVQISRFDASSMWMRRSNGDVRQWNGSGWNAPLKINGVNFCATYIAAGPNGQLYALRCSTGSNYALHVWKNGTWRDLVLNAVQVAVTDGGTVFGRVANNTTWALLNGAWTTIGSTIWLATGPGPVLAALKNDAADMQTWAPSAGWTRAPGEGPRR